MNEEASMGKRRPITRADEDEVRRRVARALGDDADKVGNGFGWYAGEDGRLNSIERVNHRGVSHGLNAREILWLAREGIFPGANGWEIEDAPAVSDAPPVAVPPVDREQAIREALLAAFAALHTAREVDLLLHVLNGAQWEDPKPVLPDIRAALASIGAVKEGHRWRLSDGPPRGWEWRSRAEDRGSNALIDYLSAHHADTWHANESAAAFAVRLLRSADDTIETLRREADGADAARAVVATERDTFREEARRLREQVGALDRELASAREGARGLGVTCQAAQEARDVYQKRAEAAESKLVYARGEIEAMADQVARLTQLLSGKVDA